MSIAIRAFVEFAVVGAAVCAFGPVSWAAASTAATAAVTPVNSVETIISDMLLPHAGRPHGVPESYDWAAGPRVGMGNSPGRFAAMTAWGQLYEDADGNPASNTRVQLKNIRAYYLSAKDGQWHLWQKSVGVEGAQYREDFVDDANQPAPAKQLKDGSLTVKAGGGFNYHFWPTTGRKAIKGDDIAGVFTTVQARLIVDDDAKPDDRPRARYLLGMGGDYWLSVGAAWDNFTTNGDIAIARFKYVTSEWQAFNMCTVAPDILRKVPPPLE